MCEPSQGDDRTRKVTVGMDVAKNNVASPTSGQVWIREGNDGKRFFLFKFASIEGVEYVLRNGRPPYGRILIKINVYNEFSDHLVMPIPNLEGSGYTKETIRIEYEWKPPYCSSCLIFGHSLVDCPKVVPKRVVNQKDKGKHVLVDDDGKSLENVNYLSDLGNNDEVEPVDNEMTTFLASKPIGVGYGSKSLLKL
uniref:Zinc knuckle CX2CX4HX4C n=1 Tax=Tanacetum cinerariifolium TaxID=118510 RepID=A0A699JNN7_TANCI|nr:hypothetical protein [Tanacetum cinerariifolium]